MSTNIQKLNSLFASFLIEADLNSSQQERARELLIAVEMLMPEWEPVTEEEVRALLDLPLKLDDRDAQEEIERNI